MVARVRSLAYAPPRLLPQGKTGGWLDGDWRSDAAHEKAQTYLLCPEHGHRAVRLLRHLRVDADDAEDIHWTPCWAGDDAVRHCAVCGVELDLGGLTDYAVDDVLNPDCCPTAEELRQAADAMTDGDPRWARWTEAAEALLGRSRNDPLKALADAIEADDLRVTLGLSPEQRALVVAMLSDGASWTEIGAAIGWAPDAVRDWYEQDRGFVVLRDRGVVSHVARAKALGWERWTREGRHVWRVPGMPFFWSYRDGWSMCVGGAWLDFVGEDEALEHALLLRDVVLS